MTALRTSQQHEPAKTCPTCTEALPLSEYHANKRARDGRQAVCRECTKARVRQWRRDNAERMSATSRRWYAANREARIEADRRWRAENPERARDLARRQNRRKRLGRNAESVEWATIVLADPCVYCGRPSEHIDHIQAKARGGSNEWLNLTGACADCNAHKGDAPLLIALLRQMDRRRCL